MGKGVAEISRNLSIKPKALLWGEEFQVKESCWLNITQDGRVHSCSEEPLPDAVQIEEPDSLLVPGFINAHTHVIDGLFKDVRWDLSIEELMYPPNGLKHRLLNETPREELELGLKYTLKSMRGSGTTYFSDFREGGLEGVTLLEKVAKTEKFRCQILGRPHGSETELSILSEQKAHGLGLPTLDNVSPSILQGIRELNTEKKIIAWHLSERSREPELLALTEAFPPDFIVHGTHLTISDIERLGEKKVGIVFCPRSNLGLGVGIPPLLDALQKNPKIALGTDNVMAVDPDLFRELEFAYRLINLNPDAKKISPKSLLELVTTRAAKVLGVEKDRGCLAKGKFGDFFLVDLRGANLYCKPQDFVKCLINRVKSENVRQVYQEGIQVLNKYRPVTES
jgi:cytosine/adenosine deaminase-related metal-dependent hydrolase